MKEVGDKFGAGELILPFVLQSAEVMKKAVSQLENYLEKQEGSTKGTVVLATVYGDVHDIGKNLVNTILTNNGYTVHDLGKQVPVSTIIDKAVEVNATAIGLSALLVSTSKQMPLCVKELHHQGLTFPVIIGGAAINRPYAHRTLFVDEETPYGPGVFYAKDAFEGLSLMDQDHPARCPNRACRAYRSSRRGTRWKNHPATRSCAPDDVSDTDPVGDIRRSILCQRRHSGALESQTTFHLPDIWPHLDLKTHVPPALGRQRRTRRGLGRAAARRFQCPAWQGCRLMRSHTGWLQPRVRYGYFPANSDGNDLIIFDPYDQHREIARLQFPPPASARATLPVRLLPAD